MRIATTIAIPIIKYAHSFKPEINKNKLITIMMPGMSRTGKGMV
jgi:hypothetical protein